MVLASPVKARRTPAKRVVGGGIHGNSATENVKGTDLAFLNEKNDGKDAIDKEKQTPSTAATTTRSQSQFQALKQIFAGLVSVYTIMKRRNKPITFSSIKDAVEQASRRRFGVGELNELARVVPDMVVLEDIRVGGDCNGHSDVLVRVNLPKGGAGVAMEAFGVAVEQAAKETKETKDMGGTKNNIVVVGATPKDGSRTPDSSAKCRRKVNPRMRSVLQSPTSRRLSELVNVCENGDDGTGTTASCGHRHVGIVEPQNGAPDAAQPSERVPMAPILSIEENKDLYARTLSGVISTSSLQQLAQNEQRHAALSSTQARAARQERATLASLPDTLQRVMAVFGRKGARCMGMVTVCQRVRGGGLETVKIEDVEGRIRALAVHAGEFLTIEKGRGGVEEVFVRTKGFDVSACMQRLKALRYMSDCTRLQ